MNRIPIPLPPVEIQDKIVAAFETERALIESNQKLITIFEAKIKTKLDKIWGILEKADTESDTQDVQIETQKIGDRVDVTYS